MGCMNDARVIWSVAADTRSVAQQHEVYEICAQAGRRRRRKHPAATQRPPSHPLCPQTCNHIKHHARRSQRMHVICMHHPRSDGVGVEVVALARRCEVTVAAPELTQPPLLGGEHA